MTNWLLFLHCLQFNKFVLAVCSCSFTWLSKQTLLCHNMRFQTSCKVRRWDFSLSNQLVWTTERSFYWETTFFHPHRRAAPIILALYQISTDAEELYSITYWPVETVFPPTRSLPPAKIMWDDPTCHMTPSGGSTCEFPQRAARLINESALTSSWWSG